MASYFQLSSMPKRLLQYALSSLEVFETDALDLENLDIAWGKNSTFEFKDVGLRLKKLETLLQLPSTIALSKAKVLLLRLTIPVDIYSSPILVEVDGVDVQLRVREEKGAYNSRTNHDRLRKKSTSKNQNLDPTLPTAEDLAASFLQMESREEKEELEAAILGETQDVSESVTSNEGGDSPVGTGTALSLPAFMARFLQGIVDRLQVRVHGITFNVDLDIPAEGPTPSRSTDPVTVQLKIDDVDIEGVTHDIESTQTKEGKDITSLFKEGKRLVCLSNIQGALITEANLFQTLSRSSSVISPVPPHSDVTESRRATEKKRSSEETQVMSMESVGAFDRVASPSPSSSPASSLRVSEFSLPEIRRPSPLLRPVKTSPRVKASTVANDSGRFDDASEDGHSSPSGSEHGDIDTSEMGDSLLQSSAILDQITDSLLLDHPEGDDDMRFSQSQSEHSTPGKNSRTSTPRASAHISSPSSQAPEFNASHSINRAHNMLQSTMLPPRAHTRFSVERISHSQPTLPPATAPLDRTYLVQQSRIPSEDSMSESSSSTFNEEIGDDLAQSQLFSHEEAESMYMSAVSFTSAAPIPGGWADSGTDSEDARSPPLTPTDHTVRGEKLDNLENARHSIPSDGASDIDSLQQSTILPLRPLHASIRSIGSMHPETPRQSQLLHKVSSDVSVKSTVAPDDYNRMTKQIFSLDQVAIYIPAMNNPSSDPVDAAAESALFGSTFDGHSDSHSNTMDLPGAFSTHLPREQRSQSSPKQTPKVPIQPTQKPEENKSIEVDVGNLLAQFDVSIGRLIYKLVCQIQDSMKKKTQAATVSSKPTSSSPEPHLRVSAQTISLKFLEHLKGTLGSRIAEPQTKALDSDVLLKTTIKGLNVSRNPSDTTTKTSITLQKFVFGYAQENIISFDAGLQMRASTRDLAASAGIDVSANIYQSHDGTRFEVHTLPLHVAVDLQHLDETFSWFGGLSSVLNLGSSMASNTTVISSPVIKPKSKGVKFNTPIEPDDQTMAVQNKADVRIGGLILDLVGTECSVGVETSAVKLISREEGIGIGIDKIKLSGPHLRHSVDDPAIVIDVSTTRVEFLNAPKDNDIDRLLALIAPSNSKYDQDDDILLDTLLRQRQQGSVLRLTVDDLQAKIGRLHELSYLPELGEEVARLSTVTKYLPDDDRPGLLSLVKIKKLGVDVDVNNSVGSLQLKVTDLDMAQIPIPSLVALSVGTVSAYRNYSEELIGAGTDQVFNRPELRIPSIMARLIGDEMEPIVKIKLWNLRVEYRVPTLMVLLGLADTATGNEMSASITASVATLRDLAQPQTPKGKEKGVEKSPASSSSPAKPMTIDIVLKDCIMGLNPLGLPSKILAVLTEAHVAAVLPKDQNASVTAELSKASLLVIDNVAHLASTAQSDHKRNSFNGGSNQVADLTSTGYVSVSYISSAKATVLLSVDDDGQNCLDVELRDDLFVLESCADSTQTLIGVLGKLAPPGKAPKKEENTYQTKVVPLNNLLASVSIDAFGTPEGQYEFSNDFTELGDLTEEGESELGFDSDYCKSSSDDGYKQAVLDDAEDSLASLNLTARDTRDGILLDSFVEEPEIDNVALSFHEDHFGTGTSLEHSAHRWNSARNTYDTSNYSKVKKSPLRVRVRDVHIIWNLFDGYDWQDTRDTISKAVQDIESKAIEKRARNERRSTWEQDIDDDEDTERGTFLLNSMWIDIPNSRDPRELAAAINQQLNDNATETESIATTNYTVTPSRQGGGRAAKKLRLNRTKHHKIAFELKGVCVDLVTFPPFSGETQSSIDIRVNDLEVFDNIRTSTWRKFATYMQDAGEREKGSNMVHIEIINVKPVPTLAATEMVIKVTILPLRLHVDQDALDFITRFFEFKVESDLEPEAPGEKPFLQRVEVNSIDVKLDFKPKRVDYSGLRSGRTTEFMNFMILDGADMTLRHCIIHGCSGFDKMGQVLNDIWTPDVKENQLPGILAGLAPVRSIVNVGSGFKDLVVVPMNEYKKDGRIVRNISRGAAIFAKTTGTELVKLGAKVAIGVQTVLQGAEGLLGPQDASLSHANSSDDEDERKQISLYANQPVGVMQGLRGGYASLQRDLIMARDAIIAVPGEVMEDGNAKGVLKAVRKHAPTVILRPVIGVAKGAGQVLMGATNTLDKKNLERVDAKYKKH